MRLSAAGFASYPFGVVLVLTGFSFIVGRFSVQFPAHSQDTGGLSAARAALKCEPCLPCEQARRLDAALSVDASDMTRPNPIDWNAMSEAAGLTQKKPPVKPAQSGVASYTIQPFQVLSHFPRIVVFPNFLDAERAQAMIKMAAGRLAASGLALKAGDTEANTRDVRTSQGTFLSSHMDSSGVLSWIEERIAQVTGVPANYGEAFNVLKYVNGQHYDAHYDVFDPAQYGPQPSNRIATVLLILQAPDEGGETVFPLEGIDGVDRLSQPGFSYKSCDIGYKYKPRTGDALLFWSVGPDGEVDKRSLHGGCPVVSGTKWVATKWIRNKPGSGGM